MKYSAQLCVLTAAFSLSSFLIGCGGSSNNSSQTASSAPVISALSPSSATAGNAGLTLTVTGSNFVAGSEITWQGIEQPTLYVSSTSLEADLPASDLATAATIQVAVEDPAGSGGATSGNLPFLISTSTSPNPIPVLTSINPNSVIAGSGNTLITLTGSSFISGSAVMLNGGTALSSTYQSSTSMTATIPASYLQSTGTLTISVTNPAPGGGTSSTVSLSVSSSSSTATAVNVTANDLAWDPVNQVIYLSLPSADGSNGNSIQVLNPFTGALGTAVFAGSEPDLLAVSASSKYLYAALDGSSAVQRFNLPGLSTDINISLGPSSFYGPYIAMDLEASPAGDGTIAFVLGTLGVSPEEEGGVHIYDDTTPRLNALCGWIQIGCTSPGGGELFDSIQWDTAADAMYILNNEDTGFNFYTVPVTASGFGTVTDHGSLAGGFGDALHYDATTKLLYTDYGVVINPVTGLKAGSIDASGLAVPDGKDGLIFYLGQTQSNFGSGTYTIESFDINHLTPVGTFTVKNVAGTPTHFTRWGSNGLAFTTGPSISNSSTPGAVYLISNSFVTTTDKSVLEPAENVRRSWHSPDTGTRTDLLQ